MRLRAGQLLELVADEERLNEEKEKARLVAAKFSSGEATVENVHANQSAAETGDVPNTLMLDEDFMNDGIGSAAKDAGQNEFVSAEAVSTAAHEAISTEVDFQDQEQKRYAQWKAQQAASAAPAAPAAPAQADPFSAAAPAVSAAPVAPAVQDPFAAPAPVAPMGAAAPVQADPLSAAVAAVPAAPVAATVQDPFAATTPVASVGASGQANPFAGAAPAAPAGPAAQNPFGMSSLAEEIPPKDNISSITDMYASTAQPSALNNFGAQVAPSMPGSMAYAGAMPAMGMQSNMQEMPGMVPQQAQMPGMMPQQVQMPGMAPQQMQMPGMVPQQTQMPGMVPQQVPQQQQNAGGGDLNLLF